MKEQDIRSYGNMLMKEVFKSMSPEEQQVLL